MRPSSDWKAQPLRALLVDDTPGFWGEAPTGNGDIAVLRSTNLRNDGRLDLSDIALRSFPERKRTQKRLEVGDILLERSGGGPQQPVGRVALFEAQGEFAFSNFMQRLRPNAMSVLSRFLYYALWDLHARGETSRLQQATTGIRNLRYDEYLARTLPLPPLPEQRKIAAILSSVDETIEKTEAVIEQLDVVKKAMLEELLTRGIPGRHSRFKKTEIGELPEEWGLKVLGDFASVKGGKRMPKGRPFAQQATPHPYIRVSDFDEGTVRLSDLRYVLPEDQKAIRAYTISRTDLYISIAGTLGLVGLVPPELDGAQLTENAAKICAIDATTVHAPYLMFALQGEPCQEQLGRLKGVGAGVPKLALFRIASVHIALPPLDEQRMIAVALSSLDDRRRRERLCLRSLGQMKGALSAALLSGDVRVVEGTAE